MKIENGQVLVIGIKRNVKNDRISYNLYGQTPFDPYFKDSVQGMQTFEEWTTCDLSGLKIGDIIVPLYAKGREGKAYMRDYSLCSPS